MNKEKKKIKKSENLDYFTEKERWTGEKIKERNQDIRIHN